MTPFLSEYLKRIPRTVDEFPMDDLEKRLLAGAAYRIFHEELARRIAEGKVLLASESQSPSVDQLHLLGAHCHTIRGGAGFFKLSALADLACQLEMLLLEAKEVVPSEVEQARDLFEQLSVTALTIPPPRMENGV